MHVVRLACARPDTLGRRLSQWDGEELARQLMADGLVEDLSAATVRRLLAAHQLKPWRQHGWLYPKPPRDAAFSVTGSELIDLYTRPLRPDALVLSVDETTSLQPRPRHAPPRPAPPQNRPHRHAHASKRAGALKLLAAFDTRAGQVYGPCDERKRQQKFSAFLEHLDQAITAALKTIHLVCDNVSTPQGKTVRKGLVNHARVVVHCTPGQCSWMHQVAQWLSILQRKRLRLVDVESKDHLRQQLEQFIREGKVQAPPFHWSTKSGAKVMAAAPAMAA
jgi:hypothetical protein